MRTIYVIAGNARLAAIPLRLPFALRTGGDGVGPTGNDL
jgi:hypothetical protein